MGVPAPLARIAVVAVVVATAACSDAGVHTESARDRSADTEPPPAAEPPPTSEPPASDPPATEPPATDPPATEPPASTSLSEGEASDSAGDSLLPDLGSADLDVQEYDVRLTYDPDSRQLNGTVTISTAVARAVDELILDAGELTVETVTLAGAATEFEHRDGELIIDAGDGMVGPTPPNEPVELAITYRDEAGAVPSGGLSPEGWFPTDTGSFVLNEPDGAHTWMPANDHPSDKATWRFELTVPDGTAAIANGHLVEQRQGRGRDTWVWEQREPMATYLVQLLTGNYKVVDGGTAGDTPLVNVALRRDVERMQTYFDLTDDQIAFFEPLFGPYPLDQYGLAFTESFSGLAMETQGRSLFSRDDFTAAEPGLIQQLLLSHELAHQWFGNAVTPADWSDLWLNESFASYAAWLWLDHVGLWDLDEQAEANLQQRQSPTEPTGTPTRENLFGYERYDGGAVVVHALRGQLGDDAFFELLARWVADNDGTSRTTADFIALAEEISGQQLDEFFDTWLYADALPPEYP
jgi:aminopeptidase N